MKEYPLISEYIEAIKSAEDNFEQLKNLRPVLDEDGNPVMSSGNFAVVFKMKDEVTGKLHAVKCFLKEQEGRAEAYRMIAEELEFVNSTFLTPIKYLDKELFVDTNNSDETEFPVLLMDWVEGRTLDKYIREHIDDQYELSLLAYQFSRLAMWLMPQPFAHGDLKPDNILVKDDGSLVLVDYDGMYVPAMKGQKARELGSPDFRHPSRTEDDFDEHIDDFSIASILLSLKALALQPTLLENNCSSDHLLLSEKDYWNLSQSLALEAFRPLLYDSELATLYSLFILASSLNNLSQVSFRLFNLSRPVKTQYDEENLCTKVTEEDLANALEDEFGGIYSQDWKVILGLRSLYKREYVIKNGTEIICNEAFCDLGNEIDYSYLDKIIIPSSVKTIGYAPFNKCLSEIICYSPFFEVDNKTLYTKDKKRLIQCYADCEEFFIPDSVEHIDNFAFYGCKSKRIIIPASVNRIGVNPFVEINRKEYEFDIISHSPIFLVKNKSLYDNNLRLISYWGKDKTITLQDGVKEIGEYAFFASEINTINLPGSINNIGDCAFGWCFSLKHVLVPSNSAEKFNRIMNNYKDMIRIIE